MEKPKTFYITTPIYYPNARPHLGHAYTSTIADVVARCARLRGAKTHFLTGTDEHGAKIVRTAHAEGKEPQAFVDEMAEHFKRLFEELGISYDQFIRTSDQSVHWPGSQALWQKLVQAGDIYKAPYEGLYCVGHEAFLTEKELGADGKCPDHGVAPEHIKEENYFFRLSKYTSDIKRRIETGELVILPEERRNEILALLHSGLADISFSRPRANLSWGIPVPGDADQTMYVWCDALSNYITAIGYGRDEKQFKQFWPADYHVIGKDILRFHAAIWPAMLISAGLALPKCIMVHGLIMSGGRKMSKTLGNVVDPTELIEQYGADAVRYYLCRHVSPFSDGDMTKEGFRDVYNGELANGIGNQVSRVMKMAEEHLGAPVSLTEDDSAFEPAVMEFIERFELNRAMDLIFEHVAKGDLYVQEREPYKKIRSTEPADSAQAKADIEKLVRHVFKLAVHLEPFMPDTAKEIQDAVRNNKKPKNLFPRLAAKRDRN
ncbi:MAG TPA: methionine--tRNA ligase [Candidatus Paceibacterota bacterium]|jgi:methionyl-tRNA synthetase